MGKGIQQAALPLALLCALSLNRKVLLRPNVFLCLVSLIALGTILTTLQPQHVGTIYRTFQVRRVRGLPLAADAVVGQA